MKKIITLYSFLITINCCYGQSIGIGTDTPDSSAILELKSQNKGFLPTRLALDSTTSSLPVINPATGIIVYNTATSGVYPINVTPGYYYWDGFRWKAIEQKGAAAGDMQYWDGVRWVNITAGSNGSVLTMCNGVPTWGGCGPITINPSNNPTEVFLDSHNPTITSVGGPFFWAGAWTVGSAVYGRICLKFDLSSLPQNAVIDSVKLYMYSVEAPPPVGNQVDAQFGSNNACVIQRITSDWSAATINWNNQPPVTTANQAIIPQSTSSFEDVNGVLITQLFKDMVANGNYGFIIKLATEQYYNIRQYQSSFSGNAAKHPRLVIYKH
jgi:hypothetical protein